MVHFRAVSLRTVVLQIQNYSQGLRLGHSRVARAGSKGFFHVLSSNLGTVVGACVGAGVGKSAVFVISRVVVHHNWRRRQKGDSVMRYLWVALKSRVRRRAGGIMPVFKLTLRSGSICSR